MKKLIKDVLRDIITEQLTWGKVLSVINKLPTPASVSNYFIKLALGTQGNNLKKVRLVFPKSGWETIAVNLMKSLGVVTGVYTSLDEAIKYCEKLVSKGVTADEFVIGSHGNAGRLLITQESKTDYKFNTNFLESFKPLISQNTKVFFTACYGANDLYTLKRASDTLGVTTYGAMGLYNYITNTAKGFYWCSTKPIKKSEKVIDDEILPTYKLDSRLPKIGNIWIPNLNGNTVDVTITINPNTFGVNVNFNPINLNLTSVEEKIINLEEVSAHSFTLDLDDVISKSKRNEIYTKGYNDIKGINLDFIENIKNGKVKIEFTTENGLINLTSLKPLQIKRKEKVVIDNNYLLKNKICGKMDSSPVTWV